MRARFLRRRTNMFVRAGERCASPRAKSWWISSVFSESRRQKECSYSPARTIFLRWHSHNKMPTGISRPKTRSALVLMHPSSSEKSEWSQEKKCFLRHILSDSYFHNKSGLFEWYYLSKSEKTREKNVLIRIITLCLCNLLHHPILQTTVCMRVCY